MSQHFSSPPRLIMGAGALEEGAQELAALGKKILIITDPGIVAAGILDEVSASLNTNGLEQVFFTDVIGNPDIATVKAAAQFREESQADIVVAVGGGSSMDVAKAVALLATNGGAIQDYEGVNQFSAAPLPIVLIPTTVGSGSEVTKGAVISNKETNIKMVIVSDLLFARIAILDARVVEGLPGQIAATTGMDALTHAIEAYVSKGANPVTDAINIGAVEMIGQNLILASKGDKGALYNMLVASSMAGIGFHDAGLGAVHALAVTLGAQFGVHHGTANALFLPYVMDFNISAAPARFARIAQALGEDTAGLTDEDASKLAAAAVHRLAQESGVPRTMTELNIPADAVEKLAKDALQQADLPGNPRTVTLDDLIDLYTRAI